MSMSMASRVAKAVIGARAAAWIRPLQRHRLWIGLRPASCVFLQMINATFLWSLHLQGARGSPSLRVERCSVSTSASAFPHVPSCSIVAALFGQAGGFSTEAVPLSDTMANEPVVSADWLHHHLRDPNVKVLDASWYMPNEQRNPLQEFQDAHIPGALFFDVDGISDQTSNLPHMLPSERAFAAAVSALGIENEDGVFVYDGKGIFSAARVWWMFRVFGHDKVWVLDGGLPQWRASGYEVESSASGDAILKVKDASEAIEKVYQGQLVGPTSFTTNFQSHLVWSLEQVRRNIEDKKYQHIDARGKARFDGIAVEPRKGIRSGHVPGSKCIPFNEVLNGTQCLLPSSELVKRFEKEGISLDAPVVTSCGTGVTACILALGLHRLGKNDVAVYDGSWTEWGAQTDTPVASNTQGS